MYAHRKQNVDVRRLWSDPVECTFLDRVLLDCINIYAGMYIYRPRGHMLVVRSGIFMSCCVCVCPWCRHEPSGLTSDLSPMLSEIILRDGAVKVHNAIR